MKDQEAVKLFHGKERLNCAQAILKAFQQKASIPDRVIEGAGRSGGGKAPGGLCGAVYSAGLLASDDETKTEIEHAFAGIAGSTKCREIRGMRRLSCSGCVALAANLVESHDSQIMEPVEMLEEIAA